MPKPPNIGQNTNRREGINASVCVRLGQGHPTTASKMAGVEALLKFPASYFGPWKRWTSKRKKKVVLDLLEGKEFTTWRD